VAAGIVAALQACMVAVYSPLQVEIQQADFSADGVSMNRAERRERMREMKRDPLAKMCPACKKKTLHVAKPTKDHLCDIVCEYCGATIEKDTRAAIPWTYV
jgi:hypothetical protein